MAAPGSCQVSCRDSAQNQHPRSISLALLWEHGTCQARSWPGSSPGLAEIDGSVDASRSQLASICALGQIATLALV